MNVPSSLRLWRKETWSTGVPCGVQVFLWVRLIYLDTVRSDVRYTEVKRRSIRRIFICAQSHSFVHGLEFSPPANVSAYDQRTLCVESAELQGQKVLRPHMCHALQLQDLQVPIIILPSLTSPLDWTKGARDNGVFVLSRRRNSRKLWQVSDKKVAVDPCPQVVFRREFLVLQPYCSLFFLRLGKELPRIWLQNEVREYFESVLDTYLYPPAGRGCTSPDLQTL